jgi:HD-GYP domain-containing protein (c-di-GMP phosphodiesterase class II)
VLLPNTDLAGTLHCAEHIWKSTGSTDILTRHGPLRLTISAGVAALTPDMKDEADLCRRADEALLQAKRRGRNMVCVWEGAAPVASAASHLTLGSSMEEVFGSVRRIIAPAKTQYMESLRSLVEGLTARVPDLKRHCEQVMIYATEMARAAGLRPGEIEAVRNAATLHDVCKAVAPTPQTDKEASPHRHALDASALLREMRLLDLEELYVRHHHENFDGSGGPDALKGKAIPVGARILAVADAYDALGTQKPPLDEATIAEQLRLMAGTRLDPEIVELFLRIREAPSAAP